MPLTHIQAYSSEQDARDALFTLQQAQFKTFLFGPTPRLHVAHDDTDVSWPNATQWFVVIATKDKVEAAAASIVPPQPAASPGTPPAAAPAPATAPAPAPTSTD